MRGQRLAGILWLIAGISSGGIAFFVTDVPTLVTFVAGAALGVLLGVGLLLRPSTALSSWAVLAGPPWVVAFGLVTILNLSTPLEEWLSVVWVAAFGVLGAVAAYLRRPRAAYG
jgi:hypothetical protein